MTTLVTGATGLLGSHLTDLLRDRGECVRALLRPDEGASTFTARHVDICRGDLTDPESLAAAVRGVDRVLHCAARTGPWGLEEEFRAANVQGLQMLVDLALNAGVKRFVHISSITVHGNDLKGTGDETAPFRIEPNPYSRTKVAGERLLERMIRDHGAPITIARPGWIYGPRDSASFARFAAMIQRGTMVMIGSGHNHIPLIHVRDVAQGVVLASEVPGAVGRSYLLVNDEPVTQRDYLDAIATELGVPPPRRRMPYRLALVAGAAAETAGHLARRRIHPPLMRYGVQLLGGENRFNITRARRELGFSPRVSLADGVRESVAWYRSTERVAGI